MQDIYYQHRTYRRKSPVRSSSWQYLLILALILAAAICAARHLELVHYHHGPAIPVSLDAAGLESESQASLTSPALCTAEEPFSYAEWVEARFAILDPGKNAFDLIEQECQGDTPLALQEFFRLLPEYVHDLRKVDASTIRRRVEELHQIPQSEPGSARKAAATDTGTVGRT